MLVMFPVKTRKWIKEVDLSTSIFLKKILFKFHNKFLEKKLFFKIKSNIPIQLFWRVTRSKKRDLKTK